MYLCHTGHRGGWRGGGRVVSLMLFLRKESGLPILLVEICLSVWEAHIGNDECFLPFLPQGSIWTWGPGAAEFSGMLFPNTQSQWMVQGTGILRGPRTLGRPKAEISLNMEPSEGLLSPSFCPETNRLCTQLPV